MKKVPYSMRFTDAEIEAVAAYCEQNGIAKPEQAADVKAMFLQAITNPYAPANSTPAEESEVYLTLQADYQQLQRKYKEIEKHNAELGNAISNIERRRDEILQKNVLRIAELEAQLQALAAQDENTVTIAFLPNVKKLLDIVCARLSKKFVRKYPDGITPALLLADMFLRYNRDQHNEWFHPFVVSERGAKKVLKGEEISEEE